MVSLKKSNKFHPNKYILTVSFYCFKVLEFILPPNGLNFVGIKEKAWQFGVLESSYTTWFAAISLSRPTVKSSVPIYNSVRHWISLKMSKIWSGRAWLFPQKTGKLWVRYLNIDGWSHHKLSRKDDNSDQFFWELFQLQFKLPPPTTMSPWAIAPRGKVSWRFANPIHHPLIVSSQNQASWDRPDPHSVRHWAWLQPVTCFHRREERTRMCPMLFMEKIRVWLVVTTWMMKNVSFQWKTISHLQTH